MTGEQIYLLRKTFEIVESQAHVAALVFYRNLFASEPSFRPLFKTGIEEQSRKLIDMLGLALSLSGNPEALRAELRELGARHRTYGVRDEYYDKLRKPMLDMFAEVLGSDFTPAVHEAWANFYDFMAATMKSGAGVNSALPTATAL